MDSTPLAADVFGDRFTLAELSLPREATGYAVQLLDTDQILDKQSGQLMSIRSATLNGLYESFDAAYMAAAEWLQRAGTTPEEHALAIVPAGFDAEMNRHILIYGVLRTQP